MEKHRLQVATIQKHIILPETNTQHEVTMEPKYINSTMTAAAAEKGLSGTPRAAVRFSQSFSGHSGEAILLLFPEDLLVLDREFGQSKYSCERLPLSAITVRRAAKEGNAFRLELEANGKCYPGKAYFGEALAAENLSDILSGRTGKTPAPAPPSEEVPVGVLFSAGLIYAAGCDGEIPEEQNRLVNRLAPGNSLSAAVQYTEQHTFQQFCDAIRKRFNRDQTTALLANQLEVMMCDGTFRRVEMALLKEEVKNIGFPEAEYRRIRDLILLKNQILVLFS